MKGTLIIVVVLALQLAGCLLYRNLAAYAAPQGDSGRIEAIHKAKDTADKAQRIQEQPRKKAEDPLR